MVFFDPVLNILCTASDPVEAAYLRQERAGILEDAGFTREVAERMTGLSDPHAALVRPHQKLNPKMENPDEQ